MSDKIRSFLGHPLLNFEMVLKNYSKRELSELEKALDRIKKANRDKEYLKKIRENEKYVEKCYRQQRRKGFCDIGAHTYYLRIISPLANNKYRLSALCFPDESKIKYTELKFLERTNENGGVWNMESLHIEEPLADSLDSYEEISPEEYDKALAKHILSFRDLSFKYELPGL